MGILWFLLGMLAGALLTVLLLFLLFWWNDRSEYDVARRVSELQ
jgi:hypothetical protein